MRKSSRLPQAQRGFTLVELMITFAIASTLIMMALPNYRSWVQDSKIRATAESVFHGLQTARAEAVRLNARVEFRLVGPTSGGADWSIVVPDTGIGEQPDAALLAEASDGQASHSQANNGQASSGSDGVPVRIIPRNAAGIVAQTSNAAPEVIAFTGLGVLSGATSLRRIDFEPVVENAGRPLSIVLSGAGSVRLCDPALSRSNNVQGC